MQPELERIIRVLNAEFEIQKAYLFGSRAADTATSESDYDLVFIVANSSLSPIERSQCAHMALWDAGVRVATDIFVYTHEEFAKGKGLFNSIAEIASSTGIEIDTSSLLKELNQKSNT